MDFQAADDHGTDKDGLSNDKFSYKDDLLDSGDDPSDPGVGG